MLEAGPVQIRVPGSKSLSHRYILCASLAAGESRLENVLESEDTSRTLEVLGACGASINRLEYGSFSIRGIGGPPLNQAGGPLECYVGESGASCRILTAVLAAGSGAFMVYGRGHLHQRPLDELVDALRRLGAEVNYVGATPGCPPLFLNTGGLSYEHLPDQSLVISCDRSSQPLSGMLLAAPLITPPIYSPGKPGLTLMLGGTSPRSLSYLGLSLASMAEFGVEAKVEKLAEGCRWEETDWRAGLNRLETGPGRLRFKVPPALYLPRDLVVEGDWSTASYLLAAGAIGPRPVQVLGLNPLSLQGDRAIVDILKQMGASLETENGAITARPSPLRGLKLNMANGPDLVPTVLALAAHAHGETVLENVSHLRLKESDRLNAMGAELRKVGCQVKIEENSFCLLPPPQGPQAPGEIGEIGGNGGTAWAGDIGGTGETGEMDEACEFNTHNDHRIAMAVCLLGLPASHPACGRPLPGFATPLDNRSCVEKSYPGFWRAWERIRTA